MPTLLEKYRFEYYEQLERLLPPKWFKRLRLEGSGPLYPLLQALSGALAEARISVESAQRMAIPETSEGFWLSLHLDGIGLSRRAPETDAQALERYRFEFSQTRNTRAGLLKLLRAYSGLTGSTLRLETDFSKGRYGEFRLVMDSPSTNWRSVDFWWLGGVFSQWAANGISIKTDIGLAGVETMAFPAWDFHTRFPTGPDLLKPFWRRPAFLSDLRLLNYQQEFQNFNNVGLPPAAAYILRSPATYTLSAAANYAAVGVAPLPVTTSALNSNPISRNLLGWGCASTWSEDALRFNQIWMSLSQAGQPGKPFLYFGDSGSCTRIDLDYAPSSSSFAADPYIETGRGPWQLNLSAGATLLELPLAGEYWQSQDGLTTGSRPILDGGFYYLALDFLLPAIALSRGISTLQLLLGYAQPEFEFSLGHTLPAATAYTLPAATAYTLRSGEAVSALNEQLPVQRIVHLRSIAADVPPNMNVGFAFRLKIPAP